VCIRAQGIDYQGFDVGFTGSDGIVCLEAKTASHVELSLTYRDIVSEPVEVETETLVKQCAGNFFECEIKHTFTLEFPPQGLFVADPVQGTPPLTVMFDAGGSFDRDGTIVKYEWDYDGSANGYDWNDSGLVSSVTHTYSDVGAYNAAVRLTDDMGHTALAGVDIYAGLNGGNGGDWWMYNHDPQHSSRSSYVGPSTANLIWTCPVTGNFGTNPVLAGDGTVYCSDRGVGLHAVDPADGSVKWSTPAFGTDHLSTPAVGTDGTIYMGCFDWGVRALSPITGDVKWTYWTGNTVFAGLAIGYNGILYVPGQDGILHAIDTASGKALWQCNIGAELLTCPAIGADGTLFMTATNGNFYALSPDGTVKWREIIAGSGSGGYTCIPCIGPDGTVYQYRSEPGASGLAAFNPATGEELWRCTLSGGVAIAEVPAIGADGTLFIGGNITDPTPHSAIYAISGATGSELWHSVDTEGYIHTAPCIDAAGNLYITTSSCQLACLSGSDGSDIWHYTLPGAATASPSIGPDGTLYVACSGGLCAFRDP